MKFVLNEHLHTERSQLAAMLQAL